MRISVRSSSHKYVHTLLGKEINRKQENGRHTYIGYLYIQVQLKMPGVNYSYIKCIRLEISG